ncbi:unnamed protein product [Heterotrigona itama]|uniref:Uncharacterized protein n=1 Tax=Heterotrigona itama TaxID=395501 RepID=A0A6V7HG81_9HYME|nr:unnamed protein product [Heterotrigona itama]
MPMRGDAHGCDVLDSAKKKSKTQYRKVSETELKRSGQKRRKENDTAKEEQRSRIYMYEESSPRVSRHDGKRLAVDSPEVSPSNLNWAKIDYYGGISMADYRTARS